MSYHLRSRKTLVPRALSCRTSAGPSATKSVGPIFTHRTPGKESTNWRAVDGLGRSKATTISATGPPRGGEPFGRSRIGQRRGPDGDERGSRFQVLPDVIDAADSADTDHRQ